MERIHNIMVVVWSEDEEDAKTPSQSHTSVYWFLNEPIPIRIERKFNDNAILARPQDEHVTNAAATTTTIRESKSSSVIRRVGRRPLSMTSPAATQLLLASLLA